MKNLAMEKLRGNELVAKRTRLPHCSLRAPRLAPGQVIRRPGEPGSRVRQAVSTLRTAYNGLLLLGTARRCPCSSLAPSSTWITPRLGFCMTVNESRSQSSASSQKQGKSSQSRKNGVMAPCHLPITSRTSERLAVESQSLAKGEEEFLVNESPAVVRGYVPRTVPLILRKAFLPPLDFFFDSF